MNKVDRLLQKLKAEQKGAGKYIVLILIDEEAAEEGKRWKLQESFWNGKHYERGGKTENINEYFPTKEAALARAKEIEEENEDAKSLLVLFGEEDLQD